MTPGGASQVSDADIRDYLAQIAKSNVLGRSPRKAALIEYLLRTELAGQGDMLKAYTIGLDVFDKPSDFDPSTDSSVRVELGRLRTAIALFEAGEFATSTLCVELPVGTYRPKITFRDAAHHTEAENASERPSVNLLSPRGLLALAVCAIAVIWISMTLLVRPQNHDNAAEVYPISLSVPDFSDSALGKEIARIVKGSFANNPTVKILDVNAPSKIDDSFILRGRVIERDGFSSVSATLADLTTNQTVWTHSFTLQNGDDLETTLQSQLNGELYTRLFGAAKRSLERRDPADLTAAQLFILATWVSGPAQSNLDWEVKRVELMKKALEREPEFGPAHSVLADKYGFLANMDANWDTPEILKLSEFHAARGVELSPLDANVMFNVAQSHWHAGRHTQSQRMFQRVTELDAGNSLARFFSNVVPYWCADVPQDVMDWAVKYDQQLSSDDPIRWIVLTWIAKLHANRGEYDLGLRAATMASEIFQVGYTYMEKAMLLNKLGQPDAAANIIVGQRQDWPGADAAHYATSTIPRLCQEQSNPKPFQAGYADLSNALAAKGVK